MNKGLKLSAKSFKVMGNVAGKAFVGMTKVAKTSVHALGEIAGMAAKASGAVVAMGATITPIIKSAIGEFSQYEQLHGGLQKLFGESWRLVEMDAKNAYIQAGVSMNDYMEMSMSFSSKLIQDLGGQTDKAAHIINTAVIDMSDNVNTFGTSWEMVEDAYKGFSRGNFRMLDNLHLGYQEGEKEMKRLLADAGAITGKVYDVENFADIIEAIHVIQEKLKITGTTEEEAKKTVEGSMKTMKASWKNLLTVMAGGGDKFPLDTAIKQFSESLRTFVNNVKPVLLRTVKALPSVLEALIPLISEDLPELLNEILPEIVGMGIDIGRAILKGIAAFMKPSNIKKLTNNIRKKLRTKITDWLGLDKDASIGEIMASLGLKIRDGIKNIGLSLLQILGITDKNGEIIKSWEDVDWSLVAVQIGTKIKEAFKHAGIFLLSLLGFTNDDGTPITDLKGVDWNRIFQEAGKKIKNAAKRAGIFILNLLGFKDEFGNEIKFWDKINWDNIGDQLAQKLQKLGERVRIFIGALFGIEKKDAQGNAIAAEWSEILNEIISKAISGLKGGNELLKKILIGDKKYLELKAKVTPEDKKKFGEDVLPWKYVVDEMLEGLKDVNLAEGINGLFTITVDLASGAVEAGKKIAEALWKTLCDLAGMNEDNGLLGDALNLVKNIIDSLDFFDENGNFHTPGWVIQILDALDLLSEPNEKGERELKLPQWLQSIKDDILPLVGELLKNLGFIDENGKFNIPEWLSSILETITQMLSLIVRGVYILAKEPKEFWGNVTTGLMDTIMGGDWTAQYLKERRSKDIGEEGDPWTDYVTGLLRSYGIGDKWQPLALENLPNLMRQLGYNKRIVSFTPEYYYLSEAFDSFTNAKKNKDQKQMLYDLERFRYYLTQLEAGYKADEAKANTEAHMGGSFNIDYDNVIQQITDIGSKAEEVSGTYTINFAVVGPTTLEEWAEWNASHSSGTSSLTGTPLTVEEIAQRHSQAKGLWSVPYDNYMARLHRDEMVLTASQARQYRDNYNGDTSAIVEAIRGLRNDITRLQLVVGEKPFGRAVAQYGGKRINGYIGRSEDKTAAGYGWG